MSCVIIQRTTQLTDTWRRLECSVMQSVIDENKANKCMRNSSPLQQQTSIFGFSLSTVIDRNVLPHIFTYARMVTQVNLINCQSTWHVNPKLARRLLTAQNKPKWPCYRDTVYHITKCFEWMPYFSITRHQLACCVYVIQHSKSLQLNNK